MVELDFRSGQPQEKLTTAFQRKRGKGKEELVDTGVKMLRVR